MADPVYALGHERRELDRLSAQAVLFEPMTLRFLLAAGVRPGMRVLDVGCGHGDVSRLLARIVGPAGAVVAIDKSPASVEGCRQREALTSATNLEIVLGDPTEMEFERPFDAVVGRLVLMYCRDVPAALRKLTAHLCPGGILAFQEFDFSGARSSPPAPTFDRAIGWVTTTFAQVGSHTQLGLELRGHFLAAGLPVPSLMLEASVGGGADYPGYTIVAEVVRSLLPAMARAGVAQPEDVDIDSLAARMRDEAAGAGGVVVLPSLVGAWTSRS